jgi:hypothetical protein
VGRILGAAAAGTLGLIDNRTPAKDDGGIYVASSEKSCQQKESRAKARRT